MRLQNTLVLPGDNPKWAAGQLRAAIDDLTVVLMLILGKDAREEQAVGWADMLAEYDYDPRGRRTRQVVWVQDPAGAEVRAILEPIIGDPAKLSVAVLGIHDDLRATIGKTDPLDVRLLESAFAKGRGR